MARKQQTDDRAKNEHVQVLSDGPAPEIDLDPVDDAATAVVRGSALDNNPEIVEPPPPVKRYVVTRGGAVLQNGMRTVLKEGKVLDAANYDIAHLQRQGIRLAREESYVPDGFVD